MPDRIIRASILMSESVNSLSWPAEVFYRRLLSIVDDFGRHDAKPAILRAFLYPLKLDKVSEPDVVKWMRECAEAGLVRCYQVDNKDYLEIQRFGQRLRAMKSKYPPPPDDNCRHLLSDVVKCNGNESDTYITAKAVGEIGISPPDSLVGDYKSMEKTKRSIVSFIQKNKPQFILPYKDLWNIFAKERSLAAVSVINDKRKKKFGVRIKEPEFDFLEILRKAGQSDFLMSSKWFGFDWILENNNNYLKVIEGNYDNAKNKENEKIHENQSEQYGRIVEKARKMANE